MLNIEKTKELYGHDPSRLKQYSEKKVVITCDYCGKEHATLYVRYHINPKMTCGCKDCRNKLTSETCMEKYGVAHHLAAQEVRDKRKASNLEKYGVEHTSQRTDVREKLRTSNLATYAKTDAEGNSLMMEKIKKANQLKYGVDFPIASEEGRAKTKEVNLKKYGVENVFSDKEIALRAQKAKVEKYGNLRGGNYGKAEDALRTWVEATSGKQFKSDYRILEGKELDLYNEELKLAIEYCGLYWHTEDSGKNIDKHYHNSKRLACESQGIRLITIFEDEWLYRQDQCKNFLASVLGIQAKTIFARKCLVREITARDGKDFFEKHHIQGKNRLGKHFAGLFHEDELIAAMSFGRHHRNLGESVLDRFCVAPGVNIPGGASRLFKFLLNLSTADKIISWSDNRWSCGDVYGKLGFMKEEMLAPDYSYVSFKDTSRRLSKQSQKKSNSGCPEDKTEKQFAVENDLHRIWDCGKIRWVYHK